jgi:hypothetical protein
MKNSYKVALLAALGLVAVSSAQASNFSVNELYLGFTSSSATSDLILNLDPSSSLVGQTSVVNLSSDVSGSTLSSFNTLFGSSATGVSMSVVGGDNAFGHGDIFATQARVGGAGTASVAGSSVTESLSSAQLTAPAGLIAGLGNVNTLPTTGNSLSDSTKSWTGLMNTTSANEFPSKSGINPVSTIDSSGTILEDLWEVAPSGIDTYEGYFTFNYSGDSLTFTSADVSAVPEPTTYGMLAGAGLLLVSFRNQFRRKQA